MSKIGFIGTGVMGTSMIRNLRKAGFDVEIYARHPEKAAVLIEEGVYNHESVESLCKDKDFLITIIGAPKDVEEMYLGENGVFKYLKPGAIAIDMTTSSPSLAKRLYEEGKKWGIDALDAPVSGGTEGARDATLTIMAGCEAETLEKCRPLFEAMGKNIFHTGAAGSGQSMKLANQVAIAGVVGALLDVCQYAESVGLEQQKMFEILLTCTGTSRQMGVMSPRLAADNFEPGFMIRHYVKDLGIAKQEAENGGHELPVTDLLLSFYKKMVEKGQEDLDYSAVIKYWNK